VTDERSRSGTYRGFGSPSQRESPAELGPGQCDCVELSRVSMDGHARASVDGAVPHGASTVLVRITGCEQSVPATTRRSSSTHLFSSFPFSSCPLYGTRRSLDYGGPGFKGFGRPYVRAKSISPVTSRAGSATSILARVASPCTTQCAAASCRASGRSRWKRSARAASEVGRQASIGRAPGVDGASTWQ
jgi:hypothetical protein